MPNIFYKSGAGGYVYHADKHRDGGDDEIVSPLDLNAIPDDLVGKSADKVDGYHAGNQDGQLLVLPQATQGQILVRSSNSWVAGSSSGNCILRVYRSNSTQTTTSNVDTKIQYNAVSWDIFNGWSNTNYRYTFTQQGKYLIYGVIRTVVTNSQQNCILKIFKNGVNVSENAMNFSTSSSSGLQMNSFISDVVEFNVNDYVEIYVYSALTLTIQYGSNLTYCYIIKVG